jgi:hypothetical protein
MGDIRSWKSQMEELFGEKAPHYTDVDILGEKQNSRLKGHKNRDNTWGVDPEMQVYITTDSKEAQDKRDWAAGRGNGPKDAEQELINMSRGYYVHIHRDFERYTDPDKHPKSTDGAKSILPENEHAKVDLDADSVKPKKDQPKHKSDSPETIHKNFKKMADKLNVDFVDDFYAYTEVKPKVSDGEKSILPESTDAVFGAISHRILSSENELLRKHSIDRVLDAIEEVSSAVDDGIEKIKNSDLNEWVRMVRHILQGKQTTNEMRGLMDIVGMFSESRLQSDSTLRNQALFVLSVSDHAHGGVRKSKVGNDTYHFLGADQKKYNLNFVHDNKFEVTDEDGQRVIHSDESQNPTQELWNLAWGS